MMLVRVLVLVAVSLLGSCDQRALVEKTAPEEETRVAKHFVELLQRRNYPAIAAQFEPGALRDDQRATLPALASQIPEDPPISITLEGVDVARRGGVTRTGLSFEYTFPQQWLLIELVLSRKPESTPLVLGFKMTPLPGPLREVNAFRLGGKPLTAYLVAGTTLAVIAFTGISLIVCLATTRLRWWGRLAWCFAMFIGVGHILVVWTNGAVSFQLTELNFFSVSIGRLGPDGPYYFEAVVPVGAIAFWLWRRMRNSRPQGTVSEQAADFD